MWLFALDSCSYANNKQQEISTVSGSLSSTTRSWIIEHLKDAKTKGKVVIGMMHHGLLEHFTGQSIKFPEFVLNNGQEVASEFAGLALHTVFTGHFHANDVTVQNFGGSPLYDIETGSLVTFPNSYRIAEYDFNRDYLSIQSERVTEIPSHLIDFKLYAQNTSKNNLKEIANKLLSSAPYNLKEPTIITVSQMLVDALMAHYSGDESPGLFSMLSFQAISDSTDQTSHELGQALLSLWTDLPPADSSLYADKLTNKRYLLIKK
jgi:hypothetical protein